MTQEEQIRYAIDMGEIVMHNMQLAKARNQHEKAKQKAQSPVNKFNFNTVANKMINLQLQKK